ncbi:type II/IV secretion system protein [Mucilaginibacter sp. 14171R-50]|uniref:GspE/PulE family protein n=1 Tax=Mucilaginibacter sp. 14171R-50 TaxID=2703789 RepID=UPI00138D3DD7|nr:GspE/PulE family protein [Mucilaginibacter sp. 14171R-50]QHS56506.1 type II/IV secretion system protein [Mucilaginibacter sp. 14171R-50]
MEEIIISTDELHKLKAETAWHYGVLPKERKADVFELYCGPDIDPETFEEEISVVLGSAVRLFPLPKAHIERLLGTYYQRAGNGQPGETGAKSDNFLRKLIAEARRLRSSDIHIETYENKCRVRMRIDGLLVERHLVAQADYPSLVNIIKVEANLDIAEKRLPQDGRMSFESPEAKFDIRVSVLPTLHGEKVVLRLLNNDAADISLDRLGFSGRDLDNYLQGVKRPNGLLLISGPTGSGKTTTLYATLKLLNQETRNVLTIEDPIEYTLDGINQTQLKESIGLTFGAALRTFLRQDPDVIMVGEIRDQDTANMAIRAAMTGHLVLSTIHTNSAWGTVNRLIDMGVPAFMLSGTLNTSVAQRLVRLLCPACKKQVTFDPAVFPAHFKLPRAISTCYKAAGCSECFYTGYKGRKAIYEVIPIDAELSAEIKKGNQQVTDLLKARGIGTLAENAFTLFCDGATSAEEIYPLLFNF